MGALRRAPARGRRRPALRARGAVRGGHALSGGGRRLAGEPPDRPGHAAVRLRQRLVDLGRERRLGDPQRGPVPRVHRLATARAQRRRRHREDAEGDSRRHVRGRGRPLVGLLARRPGRHHRQSVPALLTGHRRGPLRRDGQTVLRPHRRWRAAPGLEPAEPVQRRLHELLHDRRPAELVRPDAVREARSGRQTGPDAGGQLRRPALRGRGAACGAAQLQERHHGPVRQRLPGAQRGRPARHSLHRLGRRRQDRPDEPRRAAGALRRRLGHRQPLRQQRPADVAQPRRGQGSAHCLRGLRHRQRHAARRASGGLRRRPVRRHRAAGDARHRHAERHDDHGAQQPSAAGAAHGRPLPDPLLGRRAADQRHPVAGRYGGPRRRRRRGGAHRRGGRQGRAHRAHLPRRLGRRHDVVAVHGRAPTTSRRSAPTSSSSACRS